MRFLVLTITLAFLVTGIFAQLEKLINKEVAAAFEADYNNNRYDSIFAMFTPEMQNALPLNKTREFFGDLKLQAGQITLRQFEKYRKSYASYKTKFERGLFTLNISVDDKSKVNGLFIQPFTEDHFPEMERNKSKLQLPFKGEWTVIWGGDTKELNYHVESMAQKNAFDIVITGIDGSHFKMNGKKNEDYYAFGKELLAACDGEIVLVVDGIPDNNPGDLNPIYIPGNSVIIRTVNNEYLFYAHFKQNSILVKQGQKVKQGDLLGLCGNSGNSSEPHLHFHIQNAENMNVATGVKCYFNNLIVNGHIKTDYSPIQKDKIKNE